MLILDQYQNKTGGPSRLIFTNVLNKPRTNSYFTFKHKKIATLLFLLFVSKIWVI